MSSAASSSNMDTLANGKNTSRSLIEPEMAAMLNVEVVLIDIPKGVYWRMRPPGSTTSTGTNEPFELNAASLKAFYARYQDGSLGAGTRMAGFEEEETSASANNQPPPPPPQRLSSEEQLAEDLD